MSDTLILAHSGEEAYPVLIPIIAFAMFLYYNSRRPDDTENRGTPMEESSDDERSDHERT